MFPDRGFSFFFTVFPVFFFCIFAMIVIFIIIVAVKGLSQWQRNNNQPVLIVPAVLVSKRTDESTHMHSGSNSFSHHHSTTRHYVTFEVESGSRMEFPVDGQEFGLLLEGDIGKLKFQGTRYLGFARDI